MLKDIYLTVGEFARLHHVNRRTLHYYDDIGIFSPQKVGDNGYRYYTYMQGAQFEIILALRELGMSIEEIRDYQKNRSTQALSDLLLEKSRALDEKIRQMRAVKATLTEKRDKLLLARSPERLREISVIRCRPEYLLLTDISDITTEEDIGEDVYASLANYHTEGKAIRAFNSSYGSVLPLEHILAGDFTSYQYLFVRIPEPVNKKGLYRKSGGTCIRGYCKGSWDNLPDAYRRMLDYAAAHGITLTGNAFEEGINEMGIPSQEAMDEYVTQITIPCRAGAAE